jgi:hypothetical protein
MSHCKRSTFRLWSAVCLVAGLSLWLSAMWPARVAAQGVPMFGKSARPSVTEAMPQRWGELEHASLLQQRPGRDSGFGSFLACVAGFCALALSAGLLAVFVSFVGRQRKPASGSMEVLVAPKAATSLPPARPASAIAPATAVSAPKAMPAPLPPAAASAQSVTGAVPAKPGPAPSAPAPATPPSPTAASRPAAPGPTPGAAPTAISPAPQATSAAVPPIAPPAAQPAPAATPPAPVESPAASIAASQPAVPGVHACARCGELVPPNNLYCRNCGARQAEG